METDSHSKLFDDSPISPGEFLRGLLQEKGWTQDELAAITGRSRQQINRVIANDHGISPEMAVALGAAFGNAPKFWLQMDSAYRLSKVEDDGDLVAERARLYEMAPVKDMQRRGWIAPSKDIADIDSELRRFFNTSTLDAVPEFPVSTRKTASLDDLTPAQQAWCFRARQLAQAIRARKYNPKKMGELKKNLRILAKFPKNTIHVSELLGDHGVRFIVVEHLPGAKIDGAAFWLDEFSPVVAISLRYDRIDAFWHTLMHEIAHIEHEDDLSIDESVVGDDALLIDRDEKERRADASAAASLVDPKQLDSFVRRVGPLYSKTKIIQFAHRINMHPGIIVGQLQHLGEVGYTAHREMLVKVRSVVTKTALTDGWGRTIGPDHI